MPNKSCFETTFLIIGKLGNISEILAIPNTSSSCKSSYYLWRLVAIAILFQITYNNFKNPIMSIKNAKTRVLSQSLCCISSLKYQLFGKYTKL